MGFLAENNMKIVYSGDTAKFLVEIEYEGIVVSPADAAKLDYVEIVVYSRVNSKNIVGKYSHGKAIAVGWSALFLDTIPNKLYLILDSVATTICVNEELVLQITTSIIDPIMPSNKSISTGTAVFCKIKPKEA